VKLFLNNLYNCLYRSVCSLEEEILAEWAIRLIRSVEPLADAANVELVRTATTLHRWQRFVTRMHNAVANVAFFDALHLFVDVLLPQQDRRDDVAIPCVQQITD